MATKTTKRKTLKSLNINSVEHYNEQIRIISLMETLADTLITSCEEDGEYGAGHPTAWLKEMGRFKKSVYHSIERAKREEERERQNDY